MTEKEFVLAVMVLMLPIIPASIWVPSWVLQMTSMLGVGLMLPFFAFLAARRWSHGH